MHFVIKKFNFQSALDRSFGVASKVGTSPVLQQVFASVSEDKLSLMGSDGELSIIVQVKEAEIKEAGNLLIPPSIYDIVKSCRDTDIELQTTDAMIHIACADTRWEVRREDMQYPAISEEHINVVEIPKDVLQAAFIRCRLAIASSTLRSDFAFIQVDQRRMRATDGSKLHQVDFPYALEGLIPSRAIAEVLRRIKGMAMNHVGVGQNKRCFTFQIDDDLIIATKHIVSYPDVDAHMLNPALLNGEELVVDRKRLIQAVRRIALTADIDTNYITISLNTGRLVLMSLDKYGNNATEGIDVEWQGGLRKLGVNHNHLMDVLMALRGDEVHMMLGEDKPPKISSLCFVDDGFTGVLVQLRSDLSDAMENSDQLKVAQNGGQDARVALADVLEG